MKEPVGALVDTVVLLGEKLPIHIAAWRMSLAWCSYQFVVVGRAVPTAVALK